MLSICNNGIVSPLLLNPKGKEFNPRLNRCKGAANVKGVG